MTETKKDTYKKVSWLLLSIFSDTLCILLIVGGISAFFQLKSFIVSLSLLLMGLLAMALALWSQASTNPFTGRGK
jgi:hypothetical protein